MFGLRQREWNHLTRQNSGDELSVNINLKRAKFYGDEATVAYRVRAVGEQCGQAAEFTSAAQAWAAQHVDYGLELQDLGTIFTVNGEKFRIESLNPTKKRVVETTRLSDGALVRFLHTKVLRYLGRHDVVTAGMNLGF